VTGIRTEFRPRSPEREPGCHGARSPFTVFNNVQTVWPPAPRNPAYRQALTIPGAHPGLSCGQPDRNNSSRGLRSPVSRLSASTDSFGAQRHRPWTTRRISSGGPNFHPLSCQSPVATPVPSRAPNPQVPTPSRTIHRPGLIHRLRGHAPKMSALSDKLDIGGRRHRAPRSPVKTQPGIPQNGGLRPPESTLPADTDSFGAQLSCVWTTRSPSTSPTTAPRKCQPIQIRWIPGAGGRPAAQTTNDRSPRGARTLDVVWRSPRRYAAPNTRRRRPAARGGSASSCAMPSPNYARPAPACQLEKQARVLEMRLAACHGGMRG
jgi:hypothetical protein